MSTENIYMTLYYTIDLTHYYFQEIVKSCMDWTEFSSTRWPNCGEKEGSEKWKFPRGAHWQSSWQLIGFEEGLEPPEPDNFSANHIDYPAVFNITQDIT